MAYNVLIKRAAAAANVDAWNRYAIDAAATHDNGDVFTLTGYTNTTDSTEVWTIAQPTATSTGLWMAYSPEVVTITDAMGNSYTGLTQDPRAFTNVAGKPFGCFQLHVGDVIEFTGDGYTGMATNNYLVAQAGYKLNPSNTVSTTSTCLKKVKTGTLHIGTGTIAPAAIPTYIYVVTVA